jgi:hypothetical protein
VCVAYAGGQEALQRHGGLKLPVDEFLHRIAKTGHVVLK